MSTIVFNFKLEHFGFKNVSYNTFAKTVVWYNHIVC